MTTSYSFGSWVAQRRNALDITQRELAAGANCALATIKKVESDQRRPSRQLAIALANVLRVKEGSQALFVDCARGVRAVDALGDAAVLDVHVDVPGNQSGFSVLSVPPTPLIGRETELRQIALYLDDPHCRLITLVGPGGIGKTRLGFQAAQNCATQFAEGVCMVSLVAINTPDLLVSTMADALRLQIMSNTDPKHQLLTFLRTANLLILLDNFEQLVDGAALLTDILIAAPAVKILVTSRERLNLRSEWLIAVKGLSVPKNESTEGNGAADALTLFELGARRVQPSFRLEDARDTVTTICELVGGMPLAIELAASWVRRMSPEQIVSQIEATPDFLTANWRDVPERHRSIQALFDQSWRLLSPHAQSVLMKLAVFRGGFDVDAARQVAEALPNVLALLEDKSLIHSERPGRYAIHELLRQYAERQLAKNGMSAATCDRHLEYFVGFAEASESALHGPQQLTWARRLRAEHSNLYAALEWAFAEGRLAELGLRITNSLWFYWFRWRGNWTEGLGWVERGLKCTHGVTAIRAFALQSAALFAFQIGNAPLASERMQLGLQYSQQLGRFYMHTAAVMGTTAHLDDYAQVVAKFEEAITAFRQSAPPYMVAITLFLFGDRARAQGDLERAEALYHDGLAIAQTEGDLLMSGAIFERLGRLATIKGEYPEARAFYHESSALVKQLEYPLGISDYSVSLGVLAIYHGDYDFAEQYLGESLSFVQQLNNVGGEIQIVYLLAELSLHRQQYDEATRLLLRSLQATLNVTDWQNDHINREFNCERMIIAGKLAHALGDYEQAVSLLGAGERIRADSGYVLDALAKAEYEDAVNQSRRQLGEAAFARLWQAGQFFNEEAALTEAITYLQKRAAIEPAILDTEADP